MPVGQGSDELVVSLSGELDLATVDVIRRHTDAAVAEGQRRVTFDFAAVTYIDSQTVNALCAAFQRMKTLGGELRVRNPSLPVEKVLQLTGVNTIIAIERRP